MLDTASVHTASCRSKPRAAMIDYGSSYHLQHESLVPPTKSDLSAETIMPATESLRMACSSAYLHRRMCAFAICLKFHHATILYLSVLHQMEMQQLCLDVDACLPGGRNICHGP